jgi:hypothetical protein
MRENMKSQKIKIALGGEIYELPAKSLRNRNGHQYIYVSHAEASSLVRQYVKARYGKEDVVVKVKSASFAGGNSLDVYVHNKIGGFVPNHIFEDISRFANQWEYGKFNGMYDIFEDYEESGASTDNGFELQAGVKYVHVNNRPRFGTMEAILNEVLNEGREFLEVVKYYTDSQGRAARKSAEAYLNSVK